MWAFFVMPAGDRVLADVRDPACACWIGWYLLARELRFSNAAAAIFSLSMFALPYVQLWWTTTGPLVAFFPWLLLACIVPMRPWLRIPLLVWITGTFLLSAFLHDLRSARSLFAGGFAVMALRPDVLARSAFLRCLAGGAIGFGLVVLYLWGPFQIMADTVYPGHRDERSRAGSCRAPGCSLICSRTSCRRGGKRSTGTMWRSATGGSYALLFALIFVNYPPPARA